MAKENEQGKQKPKKGSDWEVEAMEVIKGETERIARKGRGRSRRYKSEHR